MAIWRIAVCTLVSLINMATSALGRCVEGVFGIELKICLACFQEVAAGVAVPAQVEEAAGVT